MMLSWLISIPAHGWAAPEGAGQRAGEVSRVIPAVNIARGGKTIPAAAKTVVNWQDLVNTQVNARARIALDDGSVLNVGSDASVPRPICWWPRAAIQIQEYSSTRRPPPGRTLACGERWESWPER
ncbi:MAG TPA: hypothetical protein VF748_02495 [Candidatus Acidoferrum sp.]